jgi:uridine kinase
MPAVRATGENRRRVTLRLIGIDGCGGAGKSTLAGSLGAAAVVALDDFYVGSGFVPDALDWRRLRAEVLVPLRAGRTARYRRFDWDAGALAEWHAVRPSGLVVVEGVTVLRRELRDLFDHRIWVEAPRALRLARGVERDGEDARGRWEREWMPAEDAYVADHRPQDAADETVSGY